MQPAWQVSQGAQQGGGGVGRLSIDHRSGGDLGKALHSKVVEANSMLCITRWSKVHARWRGFA